MKLSVRLAAAFVAFVVAGSLALVMWLSAEERRQSRKSFYELGRTTSEFVRAQNLPLSKRTADSLSSILGVTVLLWEIGAEKRARVFASMDNTDVQDVVLRRAYGKALQYALNHPDSGGVQSWLKGEAVHFTIGEGRHVALYREVTLPPMQLQPRNIAILAAFWLLSAALALALARDIVRPLRNFAARLPRISEEKDEAIPETARTDEIGQLARAYTDTRAQLAAEREARQQAERLAALGKMATGLAHEINNPVAAIKLHAQLMEEETREESETAVPPIPSDARATLQRIEIILAESAKIESLVSQWMFLARPQPPQTAPCDFAEILATTIRTLTPAAQHADVKIISEVPPGCIVAADRRRLSQAITNVITNAIHAMSARGGVLTVKGPTVFDLRPSAFEITFRDTGPGFSAAALASATDLFFSEKEGGMGIGLSVTAGIIRAHGGDIRIANAADGGAVVTFVLPAAS